MKKLNLEYEIVGDGTTTLIIESGIGGSFYNWKPLVNKIKESFTIVLYHRSGYGKSQSSNEPRTTRNIASELHSLTEKIGVKEKFVLLGHSFGGLCAQHFAKMYPNQLKGVVLVDSTSHNFQQLYDLDVPVMNSMISIEKMVESCLTNSELSQQELQVKYTDMLTEYSKKASDRDAKGMEEFVTNPRLYKTTAAEFENWGTSSADIKNSGVFPNVPLIVIARDKEFAAKPWLDHSIPKEEAALYEDVWRDLQVELSELSTKGELIIAENSDHEVHIDRPDIVIQSLDQFF
ncbi:alpha/beta hydrolase [Alkalihalobacillus sp. AL-G]|uniref:alpha/beta hydrolase n=1 Tax=Alkalihalobacillus sp. AL-G TaxID=2926399 RepID=UPI002729D738|nr:alpha/beta hydrolase [Alkalihalobacillus sp. AL-G]WLD93993.1 alpha/beta hydrolase [Alkalihalobacillus sp. AL-G]